MFASASRKRRERSPPSIIHPDWNTHRYLTQKFEGIVNSANDFKRWFQEMLLSKSIPEWLKFPILEEDLNIYSWEGFKTKYCEIVNTESQSCSTLVQFIDNFAMYSVESTTNDAEMTVNGVLDTLLNILCCTLLTNRNRNLSTATSAGDRPDYSLSVVFVGEDKLRSNYKEGVVGHDPREDLLSVTPFSDWELVYGNDVPFIIGYTSVNSTAGAEFELGIIDRETQFFIPLHEPLNLSVPLLRARAIEAVLLVRPALYELQQRIVRSRIGAPLNCMRQHIDPRCMVTVQGRVRAQQRIVEKMWSFEIKENAEEFCMRMNSVFRAVENRLPFQMIEPFIKISKSDPLAVKAFFKPMGSIATFSTLSEVQCCISDMIHTLVVLQDAGVIHHDIRRSNIVAVKEMTRKGGIQYVLIDFDEAKLVEEDGKCPPVASRSLDVRTHSPACFERHGFEVDIWSVGHLIKELSLQVSKLALFGQHIMQNSSKISLGELKCLVDEIFAKLNSI
jgi:hypothetical protein